MFRVLYREEFLTVCPHIVYILYDSNNKYRLVPSTALTDLSK